MNLFPPTELEIEANRAQQLRELEAFFHGKVTPGLLPPLVKPLVKEVVGFKRLTDDAILPTKSHATDSGFDLFAAEDVIIEPGETAVVKTGISAVLPAGFEATVRPRSGITSKTKLRVQYGTVDNAYRGEIGVIVDNIAQVKYEIVKYHDDFDYVVSGYDVALEESTFASTIVVEGEHYLGQLVLAGSYIIRKGDKIAQLVVAPYYSGESVEVFGELSATTRGLGGFGSTGV